MTSDMEYNLFTYFMFFNSPLECKFDETGTWFTFVIAELVLYQEVHSRRPSVNVCELREWILHGLRSYVIKMDVTLEKGRCSTFHVCCYDTYPDKKQLRSERIYFHS